MADKQIKVNVNDLKDKVIIIKKGVPTVLDKPQTGFGENVISWTEGEITADRVSYTNKR